MRCAVAIAAVRELPEEGAQQVTQALLHEPLEVDEHRGGWVRILTAYRYHGWMRAVHVEEGEGTLPELSEVPPLAIARDLIGAPYEWGGITGRGVDCSGLVHIAYRLSGRLVPRDAWQHELAGMKVRVGQEQLGDLVTYGGNGDRADHIAFLLGDDRILHATAREGLGVVEEAEPAELAARRRFVLRL
ncbi:MAG TPA: SH3 domain-containing C40 family peptidase [Gaiellaceae bacterium]|nr:SH3 domain-containing C40 family peptidase [Gaiellaceae bacterium]